jgi:hypothetical protein
MPEDKVEALTTVVTVWPFFLLHGQQAYMVILFAVFTIAVLLGVVLAVLVLLVTEGLAVLDGAETRTSRSSNVQMHRCRVKR